MNDLKPYAIFAEVVHAGSMSAAARRLGMTPSAVSQTISGLEQQFGVRLLHRSTRKLVLTEAGERCLPYCERLLEAGKAASASLEQARNAPGGELRIAAPLGFGTHIAAALAPLLAEWPNLRLSLIVDDALIDLLAARIDIALRVGKLPDSTWIGHKLGDLETVLCASPAYIARYGLPETPQALAKHHWLALLREIAPTNVQAHDAEALPYFACELVEASGAKTSIHVPIRTATTSQIALRQMCAQGMGIARLFYIDVQAALAAGTLIKVLPKMQLPLSPLTLLTAGRNTEPAKVSVAKRTLQRYFTSLPR